jgi:hypothetical protein
MILSSRVQKQLAATQGERKQKKLEIISNSSAMVEQSTNDPKFKGLKQADAIAGSKESAKIHFE